MRAFRFRLQRVLDLREAAEKGALAELARWVAVLRNAEERGLLARRRRSEALASLAAVLAGGRLDPAELGRHHAGIEACEREIAAAGKAEEAARAGVARAQDELRARRRDRKALEICRDRALRDHREEERRQEERRMDEVASGRHARGEARREER